MYHWQFVVEIGGLGIIIVFSVNGDLLCVVGEGIRLIVCTTVSAASPQNRSGREAEMRRVRTTSRM